MRISDWSSDVCSSDLLTDRDCGNAGRGPYSPRSSRQAWETGVGGPLGSAPALPSRHAIVTRRAETPAGARRAEAGGGGRPAAAGRPSEESPVPSPAGERKRAVEGKGGSVRAGARGRSLLKQNKSRNIH